MRGDHAIRAPWRAKREPAIHRPETLFLLLKTGLPRARGLSKGTAKKSSPAPENRAPANVGLLKIRV